MGRTLLEPLRENGHRGSSLAATPEYALKDRLYVAYCREPSSRRSGADDARPSSNGTRRN